MSARRTVAAAGLLATALIALAGCGGGGGDDAADLPAATAPVAAAPVAVEAVPHGGAVTAGPTTPKPVARALKGSGVVVVAFVVGNTADDDDVAAAVAEVRTDPDASRGVAFFTYRVGKDSFGDLADRLGVTGSPSVAVIGRDRTLVNLWTGLVDADILRQSISDAADRPAANPGKAAVSGAPGGAKAAKGPTGNAEGIALAKKVNASYEGIAGVHYEGEIPFEPFGAGAMSADAALEDGRFVRGSGTIQLKGFTIDLRIVGKKAYVRADDSACWATVPDDEGGFDETVIDMDDRFFAPTSADGVTTLPVATVKDGKTVRGSYTIDDSTGRITAEEEDGHQIVVTEITSVPDVAAPEDVCATLVESFAGIPSDHPAIRANVQEGCEASGAPSAVCACLTDAVLKEYPTAGEIMAMDAKAKAGDDEFTALMKKIAGSCAREGSVS